CASSETLHGGAAEAVPLAADFVGRRRLQRAVFRSGVWFIQGGRPIAWGQAGDIPLAADFDGDRRADLVIFRNGTWFVLFSTADYTTSTIFSLGQAGDLPVVGDYDG